MWKAMLNGREVTVIEESGDRVRLDDLSIVDRSELAPLSPKPLQLKRVFPVKVWVESPCAEILLGSPELCNLGVEPCEICGIECVPFHARNIVVRPSKVQKVCKSCRHNFCIPLMAVTDE